MLAPIWLVVRGSSLVNRAVGDGRGSLAGKRDFYRVPASVSIAAANEKPSASTVGPPPPAIGQFTSLPHAELPSSVNAAASNVKNTAASNVDQNAQQNVDQNADRCRKSGVDLQTAQTAELMVSW